MKPIYRVRENGKIQCIIPYKSNGKWTQKSQGGFEKMSEAKDWAKETMFELMKIERQGIIDSDMTVGEIFDLYIEDLKLQSKPKNTIRAYEATKTFYAEIRSTQVKDLNTHTIKRLILQKQKKYSRSYKSFFQRLKTILNFAMKELKVINSNPADGLKIKFESDDKRVKFITKEIYQEILNSIDVDLERLFVQVLYETGMRRSEAMGITVFDVKNSKISVNRQYNEVLKKFVDLKTANSKRSIPISKDLEKKLLAQIPNIDGRIFHGFTADKVYLKFIKPFNTSIHCFRHTFATNLVSSGIDLTVAAQIIGDDIKTVLDTYTQVNEDKKQSEFDKIRAMF